MNKKLFLLLISASLIASTTMHIDAAGTRRSRDGDEQSLGDASRAKQARTAEDGAAAIESQDRPIPSSQRQLIVSPTTVPDAPEYIQAHQKASKLLDAAEQFDEQGDIEQAKNAFEQTYELLAQAYAQRRDTTDHDAVKFASEERQLQEIFSGHLGMIDQQLDHLQSILKKTDHRADSGATPPDGLQGAGAGGGFAPPAIGHAPATPMIAPMGQMGYGYPYRYPPTAYGYAPAPTGAPAAASAQSGFDWTQLLTIAGLAAASKFLVGEEEEKEKSPPPGMYL